MAAGWMAAGYRWYTDTTLWTIVGVVVAVAFGGITVWAQFASARLISRNQHARTAAETPGQNGPGSGVRSAVAGGQPAQGLDLSGSWVAGWQSFKDGEEVFRYQPVELEHLGQDTISIVAVERGAEVDDGGYLWRGELRLWDNAILMGWYTATESSIRSKGTLYYAIHPHGQSMTGRWVGLSHDGLVITGAAALAQSESRARAILDADSPPGIQAI